MHRNACYTDSTPTLLQLYSIIYKFIYSTIIIIELTICISVSTGSHLKPHAVRTSPVRPPFYINGTEQVASSIPDRVRYISHIHTTYDYLRPFRVLWAHMHGLIQKLCLKKRHLPVFSFAIYALIFSLSGGSIYTQRPNHPRTR